MKQKKKIVEILPASHFKNSVSKISVFTPKPEKKLTSLETDQTQSVAEPKVDFKEKEASTGIGLSLNALRNIKSEKEKLKQLQAQKTLPKEPFTQAQFEVRWHKYLDILRKHQEKNLLSILTIDPKPRIIDHKIHVTLTSQVLKDELQQNKEKILKYLREKLQNYEIDFVIEVKEEKRSEFIYSKKDKFNKLVEKYPDLHYLKNKFKLDI